jgi:hypothetical protein
MSLVGPNWSSFSFVTRRVPEADIPSLYGINSSALASSFGESPPSACPPFRLDVLIGSSRGRTLRFAGGAVTGLAAGMCGGGVAGLLPGDCVRLRLVSCMESSSMRGTTARASEWF